MKTYYSECTVYFTNIEPNEKPCHDKETYNFIIQANNKEKGKNIANEKALKEFKRDLGLKYMHNIKVNIDTFYETTEDARAK